MAGAPLAPLRRHLPNRCGKVFWNRAIRVARAQWVLAVCGTGALSACGSKYALVPPRLDLEPYGRVALVTFSGDQTNDGLNTLATQRFAEAVLASQAGFELLELGAADSSLKRIAATGDGEALAHAVGKAKNVPAVFVGHLRVSGVKPHGRLSGVSSLKVRATVSAQLSVQLLSTTTGGTVWRSSATADGTVGQLAVSDKLPSIAMRDPDDAYGEVVSELVTGVTRDFRPTRVKQ
jgi:hypothetical protein